MTALSLACLSVLLAVPLPVVNDRAPDTRTLDALVASVTRDCRTDDERAIALYNYSRYVLYHHAYPDEPGGIGALKLFNVYGWSLCGGEHTALAALFEKAGWPWRYRGWSNPGHTTVEAQYGGRWHYLDTFLKLYVWRPDAGSAIGYTLASQEDLKADPALLDTLAVDPGRGVVYAKDASGDWQTPAFLVCGDDLPGVLSGVRSSNNAGSPRGWGGIRFDEPDYDAVPALAPGWSLTLDWAAAPGGHVTTGSDKQPKHSCRDKDYRWCPVIGPLLEPYWQASPAQSWSNGELALHADLTNPACLTSFASTANVRCADGRLAPVDAAQPGELVLASRLPYPMVRAQLTLTSAAPDPALKLELSRDGRTWTAADATRPLNLAGAYAWQARVRFAQPLTAVDLTALVEHNQRALPYLAPGRNTLSLPGTSEARVAVTYAWQPGSRDRAQQRLLERGEELGRGHHATWGQPVVAQRLVDKLPATFTIDVPTPRDQFPVYPRMLFLRREVLLPGQSPRATPAPPSSPAAGPADTLATLPNPWTMGVKPPAAGAAFAGPTKTLTLGFGPPTFVASDGQPTSILRWPKRPDEKVVPVAWLLGKPLGELPAPDKLVRATLVFAVTEVHNKADAVLAVVPMLGGHQLAQLGAPLATTVVKQAPGPLTPARRVEIDITRGLKTLTGGLALRIVPTRSVDDGWTVRVTPDPATAPQLRLEVRE